MRDRRKGRSNQRAVRGRQCQNCAVSDGEVTRWSKCKARCEPCERGVYRQGLCSCGLVLRGACSWCRACHAACWQAIGYVRILLLSPTDDRERIVWRPRYSLVSTRATRMLARAGAGCYDDGEWCIVATPEEWRTIR
jgi:hypothetical protein